MPEVVVRKKLTCVEEIFHEGGPAVPKPLLQGRSASGDSKSIRGILRGEHRRLHGRPETSRVGNGP